MACTTILVGKKASYNGSCIMARNDDSGAGNFTPKHFLVHDGLRKDDVEENENLVLEEGERIYRSVISHVEIPLPKYAYRYTYTPNALEGEGIWAGAGINAYNVSMTATETINNNPRTLGADPLVILQKARDGKPEIPGGIGEEDIVSLVLPYIRTAREGVVRLGKLLEDYGTYEMNGIGIADATEIWWIETIGGHHFIAKKVPDDSCVIMPNQLGIDDFDLEDAFHEQREHICSSDLKEFIENNALNLSISDENGHINPRLVFGTHDDADHVYNTPRAWYMARYLMPHKYRFTGENADFHPESDDIPWALQPERKISPEDVKYLLSSHYQGTKYDPYLSYGDRSEKGKYRSIGVNRTDFMALLEVRGGLADEYRSVEWIAFASNAFNTMAPFYTNVSKLPKYLENTDGAVSTESFYWTSRLIAALSDASYKNSIHAIEQYEETVLIKGYELRKKYDDISDELLQAGRKEEISAVLEEANEEMARFLKIEAEKTLLKVLNNQSNNMKNQYARSDH